MEIKYYIYTKNDGLIITSSASLYAFRKDIHCETGPAFIKYQTDIYGPLKKIAELWYRDGVLHRENEPAHIEYNNKGQVITEIYYANGVKHRDDGPAFISDWEFQYWYNGILLCLYEFGYSKEEIYTDYKYQIFLNKDIYPEEYQKLLKADSTDMFD